MSYHIKKVNFWICNIFTRLKLQTIQYTEKLPTLSPICLILATYPQIGTPATSFLFVSKTHTTRACTCQPNTYMLPSLLQKWAFSPNNIPWKSFYNLHSTLTELPHSFFKKKHHHSTTRYGGHVKDFIICHMKYEPFPSLYTLLSPLFWQTALSFHFSAKPRNFKSMQTGVQ